MKRLPHILLHSLILLLLLAFGCANSRENTERMDRADLLMESAPDSAMAILDSISLSSLSSRQEKARFALLKSMALDKNFIDTITFDVLQPAIDYYLDNGTPDEKLRTLYYQGRILQNRKEDEEAMECFIRATELKDLTADSLALARTYYARSLLYYQTFAYEAYVRNLLNAAELFGRKGMYDASQLCLINAIEGAVILEDRQKADSIMKIYKTLPEFRNAWVSQWHHTLIIYADEFLSDNEEARLLDSISMESPTNTINLDLALSYSNIGENEKAMGFLDAVDQDSITNKAKYYACSAQILHNVQKDREAYECLWKYQSLREAELNTILSGDILFLEKKYKLEKNISEEKERNRSIKQTAIIVALLLIILLLAIYLRLRMSELKRLRIEKRQRQLEIDNEKLTEEKEGISLEKKGIEKEKESIEKEKNRIEKEKDEVERERESMVEDNAVLSMQLRELITERDQLKKMMEGNAIINKGIVELIKERLKILDDLIASHISAGEKSVKNSQNLLKKAIQDKQGFLRSTRLLYMTLYPSFMTYLKESDLTEKEIDFICLLVLGLRNKEIGEFLETSRPYHISSAIRMKLGLSQYDTNLGIFILSKIK
ncbi:MAG: hypothetical protein HDS03_08025 [Bacteroides sp.]|nr:hypothetical protein [Bacteroides sp.]